MKRGQKLLIMVGSLGILFAVFALYTRPQFLITLSNQIWACF